jgi:hypothetical protein
LNGLVDAAPPSASREQVKSTLASLRLGPEVVAEDDGARLTLLITVPDGLMAQGDRWSSKSLAPAQAEAWHRAATNVDQFLAVASTQVSSLVSDESLRGGLAGVIADSRKRVEQSSAQPPAGGDPLPLFREDWNRLRAVVKTAAHRGTLRDQSGNQALALLSFVAIGDALFALDQQAPGIGARVSQMGLSQLSRSIESLGAGAQAGETPGRYPNVIGGRLYLIASYVELGRSEEARAEAAEVMRINPQFSLAAQKQTSPLKEPWRDRLYADMGKAG